MLSAKWDLNLANRPVMLLKVEKKEEGDSEQQLCSAHPQPGRGCEACLSSEERKERWKGVPAIPLPSGAGPLPGTPQALWGTGASDYLCL